MATPPKSSGPEAEPARVQPVTFRIFLASPGDVQDERSLARAVIEQVRSERAFRGRIQLECIAWDQPGVEVAMEAAFTPQEAIARGLPKPSQCDLVAVIFWSRMGTPLPADYAKPDGTPYLSGTEWEYQDAVTEAKRSGRPAVWLYRRTQTPALSLDDVHFDEKRRQWEMVRSFFGGLVGEDGSLSGGVNHYQTPDEFRRKFEQHLRDRLTKVLQEISGPGQEGAHKAAPVSPLPTMNDIFISYARPDREKARAMAEALERQGYKVWWDPKIPPGKKYDEVIEKALSEVKCVVVLWSRESIGRDWVKEEASVGQERGILLPVKIEPVNPPLGFRRIQAADLTDWAPGEPHQGFSDLLDAIAEVAGSPSGNKIGQVPTTESGTDSRLISKEPDFKHGFKNSIGMEFVLIPAGTFTMGSRLSPEELVRRFGVDANYFEPENPPNPW